MLPAHRARILFIERSADAWDIEGRLIARSPMFADYAYQPRRGRINPYERELWQSGDWLAKHSEHWHAKEQSGWQSGGKAAGR